MSIKKNLSGFTLKIPLDSTHRYCQHLKKGIFSVDDTKMNDKVKYWLDSSDEDMTVAQVLLDGKKYLYSGFMCHLAVEKALKAVIARDCADGEIPPKWHDLMRLAEKAALLTVLTEEQKSLLRNLNPLNIEARYPEYKNKIAEIISKETCVKIISESEKFLCWIKKQL